MIKLNIDGQEVVGYSGQTILEIARANGIEIPTLCYDEQVKPYGGCGICVVEIEGSNKLLRSCATKAEDGMIVFTNTSRVRKSRRMTLELLMSDHRGDCRPPCALSCPAGVDCQGYIGLIANGYDDEAVQLIKEDIPLPTSIGLICPHPCEDACRRNMVDEPLAIASLKAYAGYRNLYSSAPYIPQVKPDSGYKVAIVGAGPAGLTAAYFLAREGHQVTIYEAMPEPGGMLRYGIPQYRLDKKILADEIDLIRKMGVDIVTGVRINEDISLTYLHNNYDAVFLGIGAWKSSRIGCSGENNRGVIGGIEFLRQAAMYEPVSLGKRVAVIGGGNTAMDAARTAIRLGAAEVFVVYRRTRAEMPAQDIEIQEAEEEGIIFKFLAAPEEIIGNEGRVSAIRLQKMRLGEPDDSGRCRPEPVPGKEEILPVDTVIAAIGQQVDSTPLGNFSLTKRKTLAVDYAFMTSVEGIFAGGDAVSGPGIAIEAIAQGKEAARAINEYLYGKEYKAPSNFVVTREVEKSEFTSVARVPRQQLPKIDPEIRKHNFSSVTAIMEPEAAKAEAQRCLQCGCLGYYDCKLIRYAREYEVEPQKIAGQKHEINIKDTHPLIIQDSGKCILCGLCVRTCEEVVGVTALGMVNRGFNTIIKPEFGRPLLATDCISCGQCVAVCPTGALTEHNTYLKDIPLPLEEVETVCSACGAGCRQRVRKYGNQITRVEPVEGGLLCARGRFNWEEKAERIKYPLLRIGGRLTSVSWKEAMEDWARRMQILRGVYGASSVALTVSPSYTLEEMQLAALLARKGLHTNAAGSLTCSKSYALEQWSKNSSLDELQGTELIILAGSFKNSQVAAMRARQAACQGIKLICLNNQGCIAEDQAALTFKIADDDTFLYEVLAAVMDNNPDGSERKNRLQPYDIRDEARQVAAEYSKAARAIMIIDGEELSSAAVQTLSCIAKEAGHVNAPRDSVLIITPGGNTYGLYETGLAVEREEILEGMGDGSIRSLVVLGEDLAGSGTVSVDILSQLEYLVVVSPVMTPTAEQADLILPGATPFESSGTYVGSDGKKRVVNRVIKAVSGRDNREVLEAMLGALPAELSGQE